MALLKSQMGFGCQLALLCADLLNGNDFPYVALVGMPGIGKTTIANAVLKAKSTQTFRQVHMTVGLPSEEAKRQQLVNVWKGQELGRLPESLQQGSTDFAAARRALAQALNQSYKPQETLILLLDDIWHRQDLRDLDFAAAMGDHSRVLVTTRNRAVLSWLDPDEVREFQVRGLSDDNARRLFCQHAFADGRSESEVGQQRIVDVVHLSKQLPLTLSVRMRSQSRMHSSIADAPVVNPFAE